MRRAPYVLWSLALTLVPAVSAVAAPKLVTITSKSERAVETFMAGRNLAENIRFGEAAAQYERAIARDPEFALAHAYLGFATPGSEGLQYLEKAVALAGALPKAESLLIRAFHADRTGDTRKSLALRRELVKEAPDDWRVHFALGAQLSGLREFSEAEAELARAIELEPKAGPPRNILGYARLAQGKVDEAIVAFRGYVSAMPREPNPHDSLGEALLRAGRFAEARSAFAGALKISPSFWNAWEGIATAHFFEGNWKDGRQALDKARAAAFRPVDKVGLEINRAWSFFAEGRTSEAMTTVDGAIREARTQKLDATLAFLLFNRARFLSESGSPAEALTQFDAALSQAERGLPGGALINMQRAVLAQRVIANVRLGKQPEAQRALAALEVAAEKGPPSPQLRSTVELARGAFALAKGDAATANQHFSKCTEDDTFCRLQALEAHRKAGAKKELATASQRLLSANRRDPAYLYVRSRVAS